MSGATRRPVSAGSSQIPDWQPNTLYTSNTVVRAPDGTLQRALVTFTSGATFNQANWLPVSGAGPTFRVNPPLAGKPGGTLRGGGFDFGGGTQLDPVVFLGQNIGTSGGGGTKDDPYFGSLKWSMENDYEPVLGQRQMEQYPELWSPGDQQTGLTARRMYKWRPFEFYAQTTTNKTTLNGAVVAGATSIVVTSATGITAAGPTLDTVGGAAQGDKLLIEDPTPHPTDPTQTRKEIVKVSNVAGTTLTVDALAFDHPNGTVIYRLAGRAQFASTMQFAHGKNGISLYEYGDAIDGTLDVSTFLIKRGLLKMFPFADVNTVLDLQAGGTTSTAAVQLGYGGTQSVYNLLTENATTVRLKVGGLTNSFRFYASNNGVAQALNANLNDAVQSLVVTATGGYGLRVRGIAAHTVDLARFEAQGATTPTTRIDKNGVIVTMRNTAPADADLAANEMAIWFDPTNGASKFMVKAKQADGTVKTGQVALA